jgi:hypothetical protein
MWDIFQRLCDEGNAKGNLIPDAYLAALAIESGSEWITTDRDYARFPGLQWQHPVSIPSMQILPGCSRSSRLPFHSVWQGLFTDVTTAGRSPDR